MLSNPGSAKIVGSVFDLARSLGLPILAEGIGNQEVLQEIIKRGGEYGQGSYFGRAIPASEAAVLAQVGSVSPKRA